MDGWNMLFEEQNGANGVWARQTADNTAGFPFMDNSTSSVINNLKFTIAKQVRSMITILAGFNTAMALILAIIIFRNCYKAAKQNDPTFRLRYGCSFSCYGSCMLYLANIKSVPLFPRYRRCGDISVCPIHWHSSTGDYLYRLSNQRA